MDVCSSGDIFTSFTFWLVGVIVAGALLLLGYSAGVVALIMRERQTTWKRGIILVGAISAGAAIAGIWSLMFASRLYATSGEIERYNAWLAECQDPYAPPLVFRALGQYMTQVVLPLERAALFTLLLAALILIAQGIALNMWFRRARQPEPHAP